MSIAITAAASAPFAAQVPTPTPIAQRTGSAAPAVATTLAVATAPAPARSTPVPTAAAGSRQQQQAALNQLLVRYARDQAHQTDPAALAKLGRQITAAARALGTHVTLPHAQAAEAAPPAETANAATGAVNLSV
jgi:hypothetical protein